MRLFAISDLHVSYPANRAIVRALPRREGDWLIVAGDVAARIADIAWALDELVARFARVIWVPGNHELWSPEGEPSTGRYGTLVELCRERDVLTPEDPFPVWRGESGPVLLVPLFVPYDHTLRPPHVPPEMVLEWARRSGVNPVDVSAIDPSPHATVGDWCAERLRISEERIVGALARIADGPIPTVLINHFPLRADLIRLVRIFRFGPWCGTRSTERWARRFGAKVVVHGHLHMPATDWRGAVRYEEVSLGYPRERKADRSPISYLREILPGAIDPPRPRGPQWK